MCQSDTAYGILETHCKWVRDVHLIFFLHIQWQSRELYSVIMLEDYDVMTIKFWLSTYLMKELALIWDSEVFLGLGRTGNREHDENQWVHASVVQRKQGAKNITQMIPAKLPLKPFSLASVLLLYAISLFLQRCWMKFGMEVPCL